MLRQLSVARAWVLAPIAAVATPLPGSIGVLDYMLRDPMAKAVARGFFKAQAGETLLVAPGESPLAGILLLGFGDARLGWAAAMEQAIASLTGTLPGDADTAAVLPPVPVQGRLPVEWSRAGERFVPSLRAKLPKIKHWLWLNLLDDAP